MISAQVIAKMESQIGQIANHLDEILSPMHLDEKEKENFPSQPMPNLKG